MQKPIRVLCVFSTLGRGGAETMCMNLYRHIDRSKVQFDFVKHVDGKFRNWVISLIEKRTDYCLACSEQSGKWVYPHRNFKVINNAIDTELFAYNVAVREKIPE